MVAVTDPEFPAAAPQVDAPDDAEPSA
jgi:hypothetical protein